MTDSTYPNGTGALTATTAYRYLCTLLDTPVAAKRQQWVGLALVDFVEDKWLDWIGLDWTGLD